MSLCVFIYTYIRKQTVSFRNTTRTRARERFCRNRRHRSMVPTRRRGESGPSNGSGRPARERTSARGTPGADGARDKKKSLLRRRHPGDIFTGRARKKKTSEKRRKTTRNVLLFITSN